MPGWIESALWWHVYPLGFVGAPRAARDEAGPVHRLGRLEAWLDYAAEMGATGLALGPIFAAATHGYDTLDHFRIDPRLGNEGDFDALVAAARARGLRLLLDGVFNHVGRDFPAFAEVLRSGPDAPGRAGSACPGRAGRGLSGLRLLRGAPALGHPEPRRAGGRRLCRAGDDALAGAGRRRLASRRGLRGAARLLGRVLRECAPPIRRPTSWAR